MKAPVNANRAKTDTGSFRISSTKSYQMSYARQVKTEQETPLSHAIIPGLNMGDLFPCYVNGMTKF